MNTKQMQAALAKTNPKPKATKAVTHEPSDPLLARAGHIVGAAIPVVRKNTDTFFSAVRTSYRYNEAVRKGEL